MNKVVDPVMHKVFQRGFENWSTEYQQYIGAQKSSTNFRDFVLEACVQALCVGEGVDSYERLSIRLRCFDKAQKSLLMNV